MTPEEFRKSTAQTQPPVTGSAALQAMWYDAKGDWQQAHTLAQSQDDATGAWVHAYLHRVEGDLSNAGYWYRRANKAVCTEPLADEWEQIVGALLK